MPPLLLLTLAGFTGLKGGRAASAGVSADVVRLPPPVVKARWARLGLHNT